MKLKDDEKVTSKPTTPAAKMIAEPHETECENNYGLCLEI